MLRDVVTSILSVARRTRPTQHEEPDERLELCGLCGRDFVNPVEWQPVGSEQWWILLHCGECGTWRDITVTNAVAARYDLELDRCAKVLAASLNRMDRERMAGQVEAMTIALNLGLIDAADFAAGCARRPTP